MSKIISILTIALVVIAIVACDNPVSETVVGPSFDQRGPVPADTVPADSAETDSGYAIAN